MIALLNGAPPSPELVRQVLIDTGLNGRSDLWISVEVRERLEEWSRTNAANRLEKAQKTLEIALQVAHRTDDSKFKSIKVEDALTLPDLFSEKFKLPPFTRGVIGSVMPPSGLPNKNFNFAATPMTFEAAKEHENAVKNYINIVTNNVTKDWHSSPPNAGQQLKLTFHLYTLETGQLPSLYSSFNYCREQLDSFAKAELCLWLFYCNVYWNIQKLLNDFPKRKREEFPHFNPALKLWQKQLEILKSELDWAARHNTIVYNYFERISHFGNTPVRAVEELTTVEDEDKLAFLKYYANNLRDGFYSAFDLKDDTSDDDDAFFKQMITSFEEKDADENDQRYSQVIAKISANLNAMNAANDTKENALKRIRETVKQLVVLDFNALTGALFGAVFIS